MNDRLGQPEEPADCQDRGELVDAESEAATQRILGGQPV